MNLADALQHHPAGVLAGHRQHVLAVQPGLDVRAAQDGVQLLLDEIGLAFLDDQHRALAGAEAHHLGVHDRVGDVEHVQRDAGVAVGVRQAQQLQCAHHVVVHPALQDDAEVLRILGEELVEPVVLDELHRRRPALLDLLALVQIAGRRQHDAVGLASGLFDGVLEREGGAPVGLGDEAAVHVAGADAQLQHHRRVGRLGQLEAALHRRARSTAGWAADRAATPATSSRRRASAPA